MICRMTGKIHARGESVLPLGEHEKEALQTVLDRIPEGCGGNGLCVVEQTGMKGIEARIFTFAGDRFNRLLTSLLHDRLGKRAQVQYNDFLIRVVHAGKEGLGRRVADALREIQNMEKAQIASVLPIPSTEGWKFARALPPGLLRDMALSDYHHIEEFLDTLRSVTITIQSDPVQENPEGPEECV